jgi:hypothetical protein
LTPPDPQLNGRLVPRWFQPLRLSSENAGFKMCLFKLSLRRYVMVALAWIYIVIVPISSVGRCTLTPPDP